MPHRHKPTIDDVAALAGVSIKTVSRVVNGEPNVRAATREKVERAIAALGWRPNPAARDLAARRSRLIALVYDDPAHYEAPSAGYVVQLQSGALAACRAAPHELLIHPCDFRDPGTLQELTEMVRHSRPRGLLLAPPLCDMPEVLQALSGAGVVRISPGEPAGDPPAVGTDDRAVSARVVALLAKLGHRQIAFVRGDPAHRAVDNRYLGYLDGMAAAGLATQAELVAQGDSSVASGEDAAMRLLCGRVRPTAIFAANDDMAAGVIRAAHRLGVGVPSELSVFGFDDGPLASHIWPALSTVRQPVAEMARIAALHAAGAETGHDTWPVIVPARIVQRDSVAAPPARALR